MENKKTFENVENEEVVAEATIQEKKKEKKILLVFTLLSLCVYLMVQIQRMIIFIILMNIKLY